MRIAQSTSFVVDDTGNHVLVHLEDRERRHHGPQLLSRILGRADRLPHQFLCALVSLQGDQIEQLLFGLVMDVHGCGLRPAAAAMSLVVVGLIKGERESRFIHYSAEYETMDELIAFLTHNCCQGTACLPKTGACNKTEKRRTKNSNL